MQSLNRKAFLVFLALLVLDLLVRLWVSRGPTGPVGVEHLSMDPAQVSALEILAGKDRLVLERTSQGFERIDITSRAPLSSTQAQEGETILRNPLPATQTQAVETFLKRICSMVRESVGELAEERLSVYGLDPEQAVSIRLHWQKTTQIQRPFTVRFGTSLPLNVMYVYASFPDTPGLFKVLRTYKESALSLLRSMAR